jgi:hypothetical protein
MAAAPGLLEKASKRTADAIRKGLRSAARRSQTLLVQRTPRDRGQAAAGWRNSAHNGSGDVVAYCLNTCPYIGVLEDGARPHAVSKEGQEAIYQWVLRVLRLVGTTKEGFAVVHNSEPHPGQRTRKLNSVDKGEQLARSITFLICRKIRLKGQKPHYFVKNAMPELAAGAREEVERCLREVGSRGSA